MTRLVVDASVALKWAFPDGTKELENAALALLHPFVSAEITLIQPPHWLAEVSAVLARKAPEPEKREQAIGFFYALEAEIPDSPTLYLRAADLAARLEHHLFDTLYHAVALEYEAELVTADTNYFRERARGRGVRSRGRGVRSCPLGVTAGGSGLVLCVDPRQGGQVLSFA